MNKTIGLAMGVNTAKNLMDSIVWFPDCWDKKCHSSNFIMDNIFARM